MPPLLPGSGPDAHRFPPESGACRLPDRSEGSAASGPRATGQTADQRSAGASGTGLYPQQPAPGLPFLPPHPREASLPGPESGHPPAFSGPHPLLPRSYAVLRRFLPGWDFCPALPGAAHPLPGSLPALSASSDPHRSVWPGGSLPSPDTAGSSGPGGKRSRRHGNSGWPATGPDCPPGSDPAAAHHSRYIPRPAPQLWKGPGLSAVPWQIPHLRRISVPAGFHPRIPVWLRFLQDTAAGDHFHPDRRDSDLLWPAGLPDGDGRRLHRYRLPWADRKYPESYSRFPGPAGHPPAAARPPLPAGTAMSPRKWYLPCPCASEKLPREMLQR